VGKLGQETEAFGKGALAGGKSQVSQQFLGVHWQGPGDRQNWTWPSLSSSVDLWDLKALHSG
jgi:hypothetical protein